MKMKYFAPLISMLLALLLFPMTAAADTGPKPSVVITFEHMDGQLCYGTLLSESHSCGPAFAWDGDPEHILDYGLSRDIFQAFAEYEDSDGYYFLQQAWNLTQSQKLTWTYYPPSPFKILLYYPESGTFLVSNIYEQYAFDSYFKVDMSEIDVDFLAKHASGDQNNVPILTAQKSYALAWEIFSLLCRIVITIALELGVAYFFGFRQKHLLLWFCMINIITQAVLNATLNFTFHHRGSLPFAAGCALLEPLIFIIESALYLVLFQNAGQEIASWKKIICYAFTANAVSFAAGLLLAEWMPIIF